MEKVPYSKYTKELRLVNSIIFDAEKVALRHAVHQNMGGEIFQSWLRNYPLTIERAYTQTAAQI